MPQQSIKLRIGDKSYSLKVDSKQEHHFREAARLLDQTMNQYLTQFKIQDYRTLLSYASVSLLAEKLFNEEFLAHNHQNLEKHLDALNEVTEQALTGK